MKRVCLQPGCGALTTTTRCPYHTAEYERRKPSSTARYGRGWATKHRGVVAAEPWCHATPCPHPDAGTPANPLTAEHIVPASLGGVDGPMTVLCRRCNSARGNRGDRGSEV